MNKKSILFLVVCALIVGSGFFLLKQHNSPVVPLPMAQENTVVDLKDGDTYEMTAGYVKKEVGGVTYTMLAYNGSIPGPTLRVPQGATITVHLTNKTDMPTLLHAHGVRMNNAFDGTTLVQEEIAPGQSFNYQLTFPDAGTYWYHPHAQEVYTQGLGLYGAFIVTPKKEHYFPPVNRELPLFLSDLPVEHGAIALDKEKTSHTLMGQYGSVLLVNGQQRPALTAQVGEVVRLSIINAANARPFRFGIKGMKMKLVGGDNGAYERATLVDEVTLGPSERAIVDVLFPAVGSYEMEHRTPDRTYPLGIFLVESDDAPVSFAEEFRTLLDNKDVQKSIDPFRPYFNAPPEKRLALSVDVAGMMGGAHMMPDGTMMGNMMMSVSPDGIEWEEQNPQMSLAMNTDTVQWHLVDRDTKRRDMDVDWVFEKNKPVKIEIYNDPYSMHPVQHPIHFHGQRFLVLSRDGVDETNLVWKDTVLVKTGETVDILLDPSNPGSWMAHCHISQHLEAGMMLPFRVE